MTEPSNYEKHLKDSKDLARFLRNMQKFDSLFCDRMNDGREFTLRLEIKGKQGKLLHCRVGFDEFDRDEKEK